MSPRKQKKKLLKGKRRSPLKTRKMADKTQGRLVPVECDQERMEWLEAQYWACLTELVWQRIQRLKNEACYGCSHRKSGKEHHRVCMLSDADLIELFLEVARSTVRCKEVMLAWRNRVAPLTPAEFRKFGEPWFMLVHGDLAHSLRKLRRLMMEEEECCNVVEVEGDDVTDAEMLEAVEQLEALVSDDDDDELSDDALLRAEAEVLGNDGAEVVWCPDTFLELFDLFTS